MADNINENSVEALVDEGRYILDDRDIARIVDKVIKKIQPVNLEQLNLAKFGQNKSIYKVYNGTEPVTFDASNEKLNIYKNYNDELPTWTYDGSGQIDLRLSTLNGAGITDIQYDTHFKEDVFPDNRGEPGFTDQYKIFYSDGESGDFRYFHVYNGKDGDNGSQWYTGIDVDLNNIQNPKKNDKFLYLDKNSKKNGDIYSYNGTSWGEKVGNIAGLTGERGNIWTLNESIDAAGTSGFKKGDLLLIDDRDSIYYGDVYVFEESNWSAYSPINLRGPRGNIWTVNESIKAAGTEGFKKGDLLLINDQNTQFAGDVYTFEENGWSAYAPINLKGPEGQSVKSVRFDKNNENGKTPALPGKTDTYILCSEKDGKGNEVGTFQVYNGSNGSSSTERGPQGYSIINVSTTQSTTGQAGTTDKYNIYTNQQTAGNNTWVGSFNVYNGKDGIGINHLTASETDDSGGTNTWTAYATSDDSKSLGTINIKNGKDASVSAQISHKTYNNKLNKTEINWDGVLPSDFILFVEYENGKEGAENRISGNTILIKGKNMGAITVEGPLVSDDNGAQYLKVTLNGSTVSLSINSFYFTRITRVYWT